MNELNAGLLAYLFSAQFLHPYINLRTPCPGNSVTHCKLVFLYQWASLRQSPSDMSTGQPYASLMLSSQMIVEAPQVTQVAKPLLRRPPHHFKQSVHVT